MRWFALHPEWLLRESRRLSELSVYNERRQILGRTLLSFGELLVRTREIERVPTAIVYPEATPYRPPFVIPLHSLPTDEEYAQFASLDEAELIAALQPRVRHVHARHQMPPGNICLVGPEEELADTPAEFGAEAVLTRASLWLAGAKTGHFPKDSRDVELYSHFANRPEKPVVLVPSEFRADVSEGGSFYLRRPDYLGDPCLLALCLVGTGQGGLDAVFQYEPVEGEHLDLFSNARLDPVDLQAGIPASDDKGPIIRGEWWALDHEPLPFDDIDALAQRLGSGDRDQGTKRMLERLAQPVSRGDAEIHAAVRFPGREREVEWQFLRLARLSPEAPGVFLGGVGDSELRERLNGYRLEALKTASIAEDDFLLRNSGRIANRVREGRLVLLGAGALGSEIADAMAKAGLARLVVVDNEALEVGNVVRHAAGLDQVGQPKALVVGYSSVMHNPYLDVRVDATDAVTFEWGALDDDTIAVSTIADDNTEAAINERAVHADRTVYYARALRGGKAARVFRVKPEIDACKHCLSLYRTSGDPAFPVVPDDPDLPALTNECNNPIRPASAADLKIIAGLVARVLIDQLGEESPVNHWVWTTDCDVQSQGEKRSGFVAYSISKHPCCPVCNSSALAPVIVSSEVLEFIGGEAEASGDVETGGVLLGFRSDVGPLCVSEASGPGPNAVRTPSRFERDVEYCQEYVQQGMKEHGMRGLYVGEWHYHPHGSVNPSAQDLLSLSQIAQQDEYATDTPLMLIAGGGGVGASLHPANRSARSVDLTTVDRHAILSFETKESSGTG